MKQNFSPFTSTDGWRLNQSNASTWVFSDKGQPIEVTVLSSDDSEASVLVNSEQNIRIRFGPSNLPIAYLYKPEEALNYYDEWAYAIREDYISLTRNGTFTKVYFEKFDDGFLTASSDAITAPMPGKIIALNCAAGDTVSEGDALVVMEAMKMEQTLTAPRDGVVAEVGAAVGELVTDGTVLVRLEELKDT